MERALPALKTCEHGDYQIFCYAHEIACCVECQLEHHSQCQKQLKTIKTASNEFIGKLEEMLNNCRDHLNNCNQMQQRVSSQIGLEDEVLSKVDEQFGVLKTIIDE